MVLLTTTPAHLSLLATLDAAAISTLPSAPTSTSEPISHDALLALARLTSTSLNSLLRGTRIYVAPPPPKPEPSPEYVALMARLKKEQEQRDYAHLVSKQSQQINDAGEAEQQDDISPTLVVNILLSIVMCAAAVFVMTRWWTNDGLRVLVSLGTGLVVGVAEVGVYSIYLHKVQASKDKERTKRERKIFLGEYKGEFEAPDGTGRLVALDSKDGEKEEIWGKGANGGMRRRVRERWEKEQAREQASETADT